MLGEQHVDGGSGSMEPGAFQSRMLGSAGWVTAASLAVVHTKHIDGINLNTYLESWGEHPHYRAANIQIHAYKVTYATWETLKI